MTISLRLSEQDAKLIKDYAKLNNISVSDLFRQTVIERIEDEIDLEAYNKAYVKPFTPLGKFNGQYIVQFEAFGHMDNDVRGTHGLGAKVYDTYEKAVASAKRYIKKYDI